MSPRHPSLHHTRKQQLPSGNARKKTTQLSSPRSNLLSQRRQKRCQKFRQGHRIVFYEKQKNAATFVQGVLLFLPTISGGAARAEGCDVDSCGIQEGLDRAQIRFGYSEGKQLLLEESRFELYI